MTTITRNEFQRSLENKAVDVAALRQSDAVTAQPGAADRLARADLDRNGQIQGAQETRELFRQIDTFDTNGSYGSINAGTTTNRTAPGRLHEAVMQNAKPARGLTGTTGTTGATNGAVPQSVQAAAQELLNNPNVRYSTWLSGTNGRGERTNMERLARGEQAIVRTPDDGPGDRYATPSLPLMQSLVAMARRGPIEITAITGGDHSTNSRHYRGLAVDLSRHVGNTQQIVDIARQYGGTRNRERTHIHLDF